MADAAARLDLRGGARRLALVDGSNDEAHVGEPVLVSRDWGAVEQGCTDVVAERRREPRLRRCHELGHVAAGLEVQRLKPPVEVDRRDHEGLPQAGGTRLPVERRRPGEDRDHRPIENLGPFEGQVTASRAREPVTLCGAASGVG